MKSYYPLSIASISSEKKNYPHNHLRSLLDGFIDFSGVENSDITFKGLSTNSKKVHEEFLFLACRGVNATEGLIPQHGIAYAGEAINLGATYVIWEPSDELQQMPQSCSVGESRVVPLLACEALHGHVGEIAARFYQYPSHALNVIGVTGTNGKTSVAHFVAQMLSETLNTSCAVIGTLGNGLYGKLETSTHTTPDAVTLQKLMAQYKKEASQYLVMEVSSHALSQGRVSGTQFDCAVLTNLSRDHLDYHVDMQAYASEKLKLFMMDSLQSIVLNLDDPFSQTIMAKLQEKKSTAILCTYSKENSSADYFATDIQLNQNGMSFKLCVNDEVHVINSDLIGDFNIDNMLASIVILHTQGFSVKKIVKALAQVKTVAGRMQKIMINGSQKNISPLIVVDYAHTPDALDKALTSLKKHLPNKNKGKLYCIFGCGGDRDKGKRPLMANVAQALADYIVVTSDNPRTEDEQAIISDITAGFSSMNNITIEQDREQAIRQTLALLTKDDILLLAGKGHEDYQEINGQRIYFSDQDIVRAFYKKLSRH